MRDRDDSRAISPVQAPWSEWRLLKPGQWRSARWFLLAASLGVLLLITGNLFRPDPAPPPPSMAGQERPAAGAGVSRTPETSSDLAALESYLSARLTEDLSGVQGVGQLRVMVSLTAGEQQVFARDTEQSVRRTDETDAQGGRRLLDERNESARILWQASGSAARDPVLQRVDNARIRGVVVVASGAGDPGVRLRLYRAVETLLDLPMHRIEIVPGGGP
ncbi:MAG: hypothetical protein WD535_05850 [Thermaerobacterales bacterium]